MGRKSLNKIDRPCRHSEIELAIIECLEQFGGERELGKVFLALGYHPRDQLEAITRLEVVRAIELHGGVVTLGARTSPQTANDSR